MDTNAYVSILSSKYLRLRNYSSGCKIRLMDTYTTVEAAKMLGITSARVRQMVLAGDIKAEKKGRDLLIPKSEIEKAKRRKTTPGPEPQK